jgi:hypothetical protein
MEEHIEDRPDLVEEMADQWEGDQWEGDEWEGDVVVSQGTRSGLTANRSTYHSNIRRRVGHRKLLERVSHRME